MKFLIFQPHSNWCWLLLTRGLLRSRVSSDTQHEPSLRAHFSLSSASAIPLRNNSLNFNRRGVLPAAPRGIATGSAFNYLITHELHSGAPNNKPERHPGDDLSRLTGFFLHHVCARVCVCVCVCLCARTYVRIPCTRCRWVQLWLFSTATGNWHVTAVIETHNSC